MDLQDCMHSSHTIVLATGRLKPESDCWPVWPLSWKLSCYFDRVLSNVNTYSEFAQLRPAGHRSAPVRSWLKPWPHLILRGMWGFKDWPLGVIQSMTALFMLLVSSALVPFTPFWICSKRPVSECRWENIEPQIPNLQWPPLPPRMPS